MYARYHVDLTCSVLEPFFPAQRLQEVVHANLAQDSVVNLFGSKPYLHFCDNLVSESLAYIDSEHARIQALVQADGAFAEQRAALGRLLHTVQDFYAHSNYVDLWLQYHGGRHQIKPEQVDALDEEVLAHPDLLTGSWVFWRDIVYYIPGVANLVRRFYIPPNSHESMHLDSPDRGPLFAYALACARQRTAHEYHRALASIYAVGGHQAVHSFHTA